MGDENKKDTKVEKKVEKDISALKFIRNDLDEDITKKIEEIVTAFKGTFVSTKFPNYIKVELEKLFGKGWNVFAGGHFSGVCYFEDGYFAEFQVDDTIVVAFRSYIPK